MNNPPLVCAYGAGCNSTAMLIGWHERGIRPDLILFANTGGEKPETLQFLTTFAAWLRDHDMPALQIVQNDGIYKTIENECYIKQALPSLAFGWKSCSDKYKQRPQNKFVKQWQPAIDCWSSGHPVTKAIGYDADEVRRINNATKTDDRYKRAFPLAEWDWGREECVNAIIGAGLPVPPKSACWFCPASRKVEVVDLMNRHPDLYAKAVAMEHRARDAGNLQVVKGLGRHWSWEAIGNASRRQLSLGDFLETIEEECMCYDGDYDGINQDVLRLSSEAGCAMKKES